MGWRCCRFPGPGGTSGGAGGGAEGYLPTWRGLPVAGQPERSGVWRGDVSPGLPGAPGGGGRFLTEELKGVKDPPGPHLTYPVTVLNQILLLLLFLILVLFRTFPLKTVSRLEMTCRKIFWFLYLHFTVQNYLYVFFFFFFVTIFSSFFKNVNWFYLSADFFWGGVYVTSQKSVRLHTEFLQSLKFLVAAGSLDTEDQSKRPRLLQRTLNLSRRPNEDGVGQGETFELGFFRGETGPDAPWYRMSRSPIGKGLYLNLSGQRADVFMNVPQVVVFHCFAESSDTTTFSPLSTYS